jgi:hypothetical protein
MALPQQPDGGGLLRRARATTTQVGYNFRFARICLIRCFLQKRQRTAVATTDFLCGFEASSWKFGFWWAATATPLAKQKRIVAKVDALMALADTFEQQLDDSRAAA